MSTEIPDSKDLPAAQQTDEAKPLTVASLDSKNQTNLASLEPQNNVNEVLLADAKPDHERREHRGHPHGDRPALPQGQQGPHQRTDRQHVQPGNDQRLRQQQQQQQQQQQLRPRDTGYRSIDNQGYQAQIRQQQLQQQIQQQRIAEQMRLRQQQNQSFPPQYYQSQQFQPQQQFRRSGQFNNFTPANYQDNSWMYQNQNQFGNMYGNQYGNQYGNIYGNQWQRPHHHRRERDGFADFANVLGGLFTIGMDIDRQMKRERQDKRADVSANPADAKTDKVQKTNQETERSEPFTAKSRAGLEGWSERHGALVERAGNNRGQTVVFGDGDVKLMSENPKFKTLGWQESGISFDRTENLLWRLRNGEANFNKDNPPKSAVLMIGTNNIGRATSDDIVRGIMENHKELRAKLPNAKIAVVGLLPRRDESVEGNKQVQEVNAKLAEMFKGKPNDFFIDPKASLVKDNKRIPEMWKPEGVLSTEGQNKVLDLINAKINKPK